MAMVFFCIHVWYACAHLDFITTSDKVLPWWWWIYICIIIWIINYIHISLMMWIKFVFSFFLLQVCLKSQFILNGVCVIWRGYIDLNRLDGVGHVEFDSQRAKVRHMTHIIQPPYIYTSYLNVWTVSNTQFCPHYHFLNQSKKKILGRVHTKWHHFCWEPPRLMIRMWMIAYSLATGYNFDEGALMKMQIHTTALEIAHMMYVIKRPLMWFLKESCNNLNESSKNDI